jgi:hypothetical protein
MKQMRLVYRILILIALTLDPALLKAQVPVNNQLEKFESVVQDVERQVGAWESQAHYQIALVYAVLVFGALISAFQGSAKKWSKLATLALGIATSVCTGINAKVFSADYRTLQHAANEGHIVVRKLRYVIAKFNEVQPSGEDLKAFKSEFSKSFDDFDQISKNLEENGSARAVPAGSQATVTFGLPRVYAQSSSLVPPWLNKLPSDDRSFYFLGTGSDASLSGAKSNSFNDAINNASSKLTPGEPYGAGRSVSTGVKDAATVQDTFFTYDKRSAIYSYYTLLRLSREIQDVLPTLKVYKQRGWRPVDLTFYPAAGLFVFDDDGAVSKVRVDQQGIHIDVLFRLRAGDRPAQLAANSESIFTSSNNPIGCTVYQFSLGSRKTSRRLLPVGHSGCDGIAVNGNTVYLVLPGKKEIRYWPNWESASSKSWFFDQIDQGGVLTFDRSGRRLLYAGASGTAYAISTPEGKILPLVSDIGFVHSIATDSNHILLASGKKVLFYSRSHNYGENPPSNMQSLSGGLISGVAVDTTDSAWIADFDKGLIQGPFALN